MGICSKCNNIGKSGCKFYLSKKCEMFKQATPLKRREYNPHTYEPDNSGKEEPYRRYKEAVRRGLRVEKFTLHELAEKIYPDETDDYEPF